MKSASGSSYPAGIVASSGSAIINAWEDASHNLGWTLLNTSGTSTVQIWGSGNNTYFNSGNVGVGTTNPTTTLQVNKTNSGASTFPLLLQNASSNPGVVGSQVGISFDPTINGVGVRDAQISAVEAGANQTALAFRTSNAAAPAEAMRIDYTGNVGIGTTSPAASLDVSAKTDALITPKGSTAQRPSSPTNGMVRYNTTTSKMEFYENGSWDNCWGFRGRHSRLLDVYGEDGLPNSILRVARSCD